MSDVQRIKRLEKMVKTLSDTVVRLVGIINTNHPEYDIYAVESALEAAAPYDDGDSNAEKEAAGVPEQRL